MEKIGCQANNDVGAYGQSAPSATVRCGIDNHGSHGVGGADAARCVGREGHASSKLQLRPGMPPVVSAAPAVSTDALLLHTFTNVLVSPQSDSGSSAGSIREAGGAFGKREQAEEERYFRARTKEQLAALKKHHENEIIHHKKEMERLQKEIERHKQAINQLKQHHDD